MPSGGHPPPWGPPVCFWPQPSFKSAPRLPSQHRCPVLGADLGDSTRGEPQPWCCFVPPTPRILLQGVRELLAAPGFLA